MPRYLTPSALQKVYLPDRDSAIAIALLQETAPPLQLSPLHRLEMELALKVSPKALKYWREDLARGLYEFADLSLSGLADRAEELAHADLLLGSALQGLHLAAALEMGCSEWVDFDPGTRAAAQRAGLRVLPAPLKDGEG